MLSRMLNCSFKSLRVAHAHQRLTPVAAAAARGHPAAAWWPSAAAALPHGSAIGSPCGGTRAVSSSSSTASGRRGGSVVAASVGDAAASGPAAAAVPAPPPPPKKVFNVRQITKDDVDFSFARASGPGGQNVNKVNTKVDMRFELEAASWIPEEVREAIRRAEKNRFTKDGWLVVTSTRHRTQSSNMDDALAKLQDIIDKAVEAVTPKEADPETIARVKKNIKAGNERRLDGKKKDSKKKAERRRRDFD